MKKCSNCKIEKEETEFGFKNKAIGRLQPFCKECNKIKSKQYYNSNREEHKRETIKRKKKVIFENRKLLYDYYFSHPCIDCGEKDPMVLELDHIKDKDMAVSKAVGRGWSKERILAEIAKCEVRCANCHRRKTAKQQGWYKEFLER
jgi:5-methylcytosine-specific restriction endonuclease McrA